MRSLMTGFLFLTALVAAGCTQQQNSPATPVAASAAAVSPVNDHCPIMGGEVTAEGGTAEWNGQLVGFCCDGCVEKWQALSEDEKKASLAKAEAASEDHDHAGHDHEHSS